MPRIIVALTGLAGSGKSTAATHLVNHHGYRLVKFAGPLKAMFRAASELLTDEHVEGVLKEKPCDLLCGKTPRQFMQWLGTEFGRDLIGENFWVNLWLADIERDDKPIVCDDCRFPNEAEMVRRVGGFIVRVQRPGAGAGAAGHSSEDQAFPFTLAINNESSISAFLSEIDALHRDLTWAVAA